MKNRQSYVPVVDQETKWLVDEVLQIFKDKKISYSQALLTLNVAEKKLGEAAILK